MDKLDIQIEQISKQDEVCQRLQKIEGIGPITALAIIALVGNGQGFKNGRHFSAYLGLVPRQHSRATHSWRALCCNALQSKK
jgi:transposase